MSKERKAELQRKLAMTSVPRPPADLLDRIKGEIPLDLGKTPERDRSLWRSTLVMRVAASLMLLVTTGLVTWRIVQPDVRPSAPVTARRERIVPAITRAVTRPAEEKAEAPPVAETASRVTESPIVVPQSVSIAAPAKPTVPVVESAEREEASDLAVFQGTAPERTVAQTTQMADAADSSARREVESITITARAPAVLERPAAAPAPPPPPPATAAQGATVGAVQKDVAVQKVYRFGVTLDTREFARVQRSLAAGVRPPRVDVDALINHFAFGPQPAPIESELSADPLDRDRLLLRVSIDGDSSPDLADARLQVDFPAEAVREARRIGGGDVLRADSGNSAGRSVTVLYELQLRGLLAPDATVAEIRLVWPSRVSAAIVTAGSARSWTDSSHRHRRASLAGLWAESLSRASTDARLATLAAALQDERPSDPFSRDLFTAIEASTRTR